MVSVAVDAGRGKEGGETVEELQGEGGPGAVSQEAFEAGSICWAVPNPATRPPSILGSAGLGMLTGVAKGAASAGFTAKVKPVAKLLWSLMSKQGKAIVGGVATSTGAATYYYARGVTSRKEKE